MKSLLSAIILLLSAIATLQDRVDPQGACDDVTKIFDGGASEMIGELLGKSQPYANAADYVQGISIGTEPNYHNVTAGDVVGFPGPSHWLAIYVGKVDCACLFVDVPHSGANARCLVVGYGDTELFQYAYPSSTLQLLKRVVGPIV